MYTQETQTHTHTHIINSMATVFDESSRSCNRLVVSAFQSTNRTRVDADEKNTQRRGQASRSQPY